MSLIGLCGKMGSGKDFIASKYIIPYLTNTYGLNCLRLSFADQIKVNVMTKQNVPFHEVFVAKTKDTRMLLQQEGTENGRNIFGKDIWVKYHNAWFETFTSRGVDVVVVTDVRFMNELSYIQGKNGVLVKVDAPKRNEERLRKESNGDNACYDKMKEHSSECDLDNLSDDCFEVVLKNDYNEHIDENTLYACLDNKFRRELRC